MQKILLGVIAIVVLGGGAYFLLQPSQEGQDMQGEEGEAVAEQGGSIEEGATEEQERDPAAVENIIVYSDSGYSPETLTIKKGDTVTFRNESGRGIWPATAIHPSHTVYPGSAIAKCFDGSDTSTLFDSCGELEAGEEWSFTFHETGSWKYHDHLRPANTGSITVE